MKRNSLNHRWNPEQELPLFANLFLREVPKDVDDILESWGDAWFTCPNCWEYTESSICECGTFISQTGEEIEVTPPKDYDVELPKREKKKQPEELVWVEYEYERKKFTLFSAKNIWDDKAQVHIGYYGMEYKIIFTPGLIKMVSSISEKSHGKFKRKRVIADRFNDFVKILWEFSKNPDKYNLSKLKAFKK
jgi:hypothetical protein